MRRDMTSGRVLRTILIFALPIMAANLLQQLYNTADNIIVGNFAEAAEPGSFAAVGTVAPLTFLYLAIAMGLSVGVSVVCSQLFGAQKYKDLSVAADTSIILLAAAGIIVAIAGYFLTPWLLDNALRILPDSTKIVDGKKVDILIRTYAIEYLQVYCIGLPFQFVYNAIASALRGVGDAKASLLFLVVSSVLNVILDTWLVIAYSHGARGAAIATVISQLVCVVLSYVYMRRKFPYVADAEHFSGEICLKIVKIGLPTAIQQSIVAIGNIAMMRLVQGFADGISYKEISHSPLDTAIIDSFTAGSRIDSFLFVPVQGLMTALATFTGQNIAARKLDRVKKGYYQTMAVALVIVVVLSAALYIFAKQILSLFGITDDSVTLGIEQVHYYALVFWIFCGYMTLGGVLQGAGDTVIQSIATLSALTLRVLLAYLGVYIFEWFNYDAAWSTLVYGWVVALIITNIRFYTGGWKNKAIATLEAEPEPVPEIPE